MRAAPKNESYEIYNKLLSQFGHKSGGRQIRLLKWSWERSSPSRPKWKNVEKGDTETLRRTGLWQKNPSPEAEPESLKNL